MRVMDKAKIKKLSGIVGAPLLEVVKAGRGNPFICWTAQGHAYTVESLNAKKAERLTDRDRLVSAATDTASKTPVLV